MPQYLHAVEGVAAGPWWPIPRPLEAVSALMVALEARLLARSSSSSSNLRSPTTSEVAAAEVEGRSSLVEVLGGGLGSRNPPRIGSWR